VKAVLSLWKTAFLLFPFLFTYACLSAKFVPLPPKVVIGIYHPVRKGETLWRICKTYDVDLQEVAELNNIKNATQIKAGDEIFIPGATKVRKIKVFKKEPTKKKIKIVQPKGKFSWPVKGKVVSLFGVRRGKKFDGIDILAPLGTVIKAADSGKVIFADKLSGYGNIIIIQHKDKYTTIYAHNKINLVKEGRWVKRGSIIAKLGNSHNPSASPNLHFQIRRYNKARNPLFYLH
jgi:murein DD-endopeptidase MepM/ murein hydrolase activator NlpD